MSLLTLILAMAALAAAVAGVGLIAWLPRRAGFGVGGLEALIQGAFTSPRLTARDRVELAARLWAP